MSPVPDRVAVEAAVVMETRPRLSRRWVSRVYVYDQDRLTLLWHLDGPRRFTGRRAGRDLAAVRWRALRRVARYYPGVLVHGDTPWLHDARAALAGRRGVR